MPKDECQGFMVLGFVSSEYEFNWEMDEDQLKAINNFIKKEYTDYDSAINKTGLANKYKLKYLPF